jgi:precorrin-2 dehydrogenase/sirohydrochlorin ferrochelatase
MDAFPAFYALKGRKVVIAGTGDGADAKARLFDGAPAEVVRIDGDVALRADAYEGAILAFVSSEDAEFCAAAAQAARSAGVPVNVVDRPTLSDFSTPAVIDRGGIVAAIGTGGAAPMLASVLRGDIESQIPEGAGRVAALLHQMRETIRNRFPDVVRRRAFLREAMIGPAAQAAMDGDMTRAKDLLARALAEQDGSRQGALWLVDGRGPVDLLSLRAVRALGEVDAVFVEPGVDAGVMTRIRRDAPRLKDTSTGQIIARAIAGERIAVVTNGPPSSALLAAAQSSGLTAQILPVAQV